MNISTRDAPACEVAVEFIGDLVCPWCYIGKKRLERAAAQRPGLRLRLRFRSFLLNPHLPPEGVDRSAYLIGKFGNEQRVQRFQRAIAEAGQAEGIAFAFERIDRTPNSLDAHRLVHLAERDGIGEAVMERIYRAFFLEGRDIGDRAELLAIAAACGMDGRRAEAFLASTEDAETVIEDNAWAHRQGVNGVPTLFFGGRLGLAGAHDPTVLVRLLDVARELGG